MCLEDELVQSVTECSFSQSQGIHVADYLSAFFCLQFCCCGGGFFFNIWVHTLLKIEF